MLLHVVFAGEGFVADGTVHTLLPGVLLSVTCSMTGRGEGGGTAVSLCVGAWIFVFLARRGPGCGLRGCLGLDLDWSRDRCSDWASGWRGHRRRCRGGVTKVEARWDRRMNGILRGRKSRGEWFGEELIWHHGIGRDQELLFEEWSDVGGGRREVADQVLARQWVECREDVVIVGVGRSDGRRRRIHTRIGGEA